jgi:ABC-type multidrug transport system fused ATPase/permease subunit
MNPSRLKEKYLAAAEKYRVAAEREEKRLFLISMLRLISFAGGILLSGYGFTISTGAGILLSILSVILFLYLLTLYSKHSARKEFLYNLSEINSGEALALSGDFSSFPSGSVFIDPEHPFSNDVDLFGNSSLFQYLNRTVTSYGREILAGWLSDPFVLAATMYERQEAIREIADREIWRHEFMASGFNVPLEKQDISALIEWMNGKNSAGKNTASNYLIYILPLAAIVTLGLLIAGVIHYTVFTSVFIINLIYVSAGLKNTNRVHIAVSKKYSYLTSMDSLLKVFDKEIFNSVLLNEIKINISGSGISASAAVRKLGSLIQAFDSRLNLIAGFALNGLLLWDYHCIRRLENWKDSYSQYFQQWLEMLGQVDAYISLGNYSFNNPSYSYPQISEDNTLFFSTGLGHPLIDSKERICNDFCLPSKGTVCIITGPNMAGKSTFLRTIAVNYILGMTGAPVCALGMKFIPMKLFTSMRTTDSLSNHESYFYAELKRLKVLKSLTEAGEPVLFILDEILKGTNSADKSLGSKLFIEKLIMSGGTGLIATHDITLGEMENDYPGKIINKCFEVEIAGETISFDYLIHDGITHKMNAALLMKQMGILD